MNLNTARHRFKEQVCEYQCPYCGQMFCKPSLGILKTAVIPFHLRDNPTDFRVAQKEICSGTLKTVPITLLKVDVDIPT